MRIRKLIAAVGVAVLAAVGAGSGHASAANTPGDCGHNSWQEVGKVHGSSFWGDSSHNHIGILYSEWNGWDNGNGTCTIWVGTEVDLANQSWHGWIGPRIYIASGPVTNTNTTSAAFYGGEPIIGTHASHYYLNPTVSGSSNRCAYAPSILNGGWQGAYSCNPYYGSQPGATDYCAGAPADQYGNPLPASQQTALCGYWVQITIPYNTGWCVDSSGGTLQEFGRSDSVSLPNYQMC